jgi:hypothetical protein
MTTEQRANEAAGEIIYRAGDVESISEGQMPDVLAALPRLRYKAALIISHHFPFEMVINAHAIARNSGSAKVMIEF